MFSRIILFIFGLCMAFPAYADTAANAPANAAANTVPENEASAPSASTPSVGSMSAPALRDEDYIEPTWPDLLRTLFRFGAVDLHDNNLVDEYTAIAYCEIYKFYFKDDFKWNEIRKKVRESADMEMMKYPAHYYYYTVLQLGRYDFENKLYRFNETTAIHDVNVFTLLQTPNSMMCDGQGVLYLPRNFQAVADAPFTMLGLPLAPADAQSLLRQMNADKNTDHTIIVRFNMTITFVDRLRRAATSNEATGKAVRYFQALDKPLPTGTVRMDVHLDSVSFYEDPHMTKLVYSVKP